MTSYTNARFRRHFANLPKGIQEQSRRAYQLFKTDPSNRGLEFKKLPRIKISGPCGSMTIIAPLAFAKVKR